MRRFSPLVPAVLLVVLGAALGESAMVSILNDLEPIRAQGMAGAVSGLGRDPSMILVNPCAATHLPATTVTMGGRRGYFGQVGGSLCLSLPVGDGGLTLGAGYSRTAPMLLRHSDGFTRTVSLQRDTVALFGFARPFSDRLTGGGLIKLLYTEFAEELTAQTPAVDVGVQVALAPGAKIGLMARNIGPGLKFAEARSPLPMELRLGVARGWRIRPYTGGADVLILTTELVAQKDLGEGRLAVEYQLLGAFSVRGGARLFSTRESLSRFSFGLGISRGAFRLDYGARVSEAFDTPQSASVTVRF